MFRWIWLCFVCLYCFGYVLIVGYVLCIISMILYYKKDIAYDLIYDFDLRATHARTLLPAALASVSFGFVLVRVRFDLLLLIDTPCHRPVIIIFFVYIA
jgi:hypothetical protein